MHVIVLTKENGLIEIWRNVKEMCKKHDISRNTVYAYLNKGPMNYKGYKIVKVEVGVTYPDNIRTKSV